MVVWFVQEVNDSLDKSKLGFVLFNLSLAKSYERLSPFKLLADHLSGRRHALLVGHGARCGRAAHEPGGAARGRDPKPADQPVLLIGNTQNRSRALAQAPQEQGFTNIRYVNGGMSEWAKRGWPMVKPQDLLAPGKS